MKRLEMLEKVRRPLLEAQLLLCLYLNDHGTDAEIEEQADKVCKAYRALKEIKQKMEKPCKTPN